MDFDLFEDGEDDEMLLSSINIESAAPRVDTLSVDELPEFHCCGPDNLTSHHFATDGFIKKGLPNNLSKVNDTITSYIKLTKHNFCIESLLCIPTAQYVFGEACMNLQYLIANVKGTVGAADDIPFYKRRKNITQVFQLLSYSAAIEQVVLLQPQIAILRKLLNRMTNLDTWKQIYFANGSKSNDCQSPAYHLLHGILEWKLLDLLLLQKFVTATNAENAEDTKSNVFNVQLLIVFDDLLSCSLLHFLKKRSFDLPQSSAFPCTCFKEFWLIIQVELPRWTQIISQNSFWEVFNTSAEKLKEKLDIFDADEKMYFQFMNWIIQSLSQLYGYRSDGIFIGPENVRIKFDAEECGNYTQLERCTQKFLNCNPNEEEIRNYITVLMPTLLQWWQPKINIVQILWEYFHKRLNSTYYVAGEAPSNIAVVCSNGKQYLTRYRSLLEGGENYDSSLGSYTLFVIFLGNTIKRMFKLKLYNQVQKLMGRIYTKFSFQKLLTLSETGLHHLVELLVVLALTGEFSSNASKLSETLLSISFDKIKANKMLAVAKGHMALLILYAENGLDMSSYISKLLSQLQGAHFDSGISKLLCDSLLDIFEHSDGDFRRGEALLIDSWLPNYLNTCTSSEQERCLEALHLIFLKLKHANMENRTEVLKALNKHILPVLKQQYSIGFSPWFPQLAADFCLQGGNFIGSDPADLFEKLFTFFITCQTLSSNQTLPRFLVKILESEGHPQVDVSVIMHVWLRSLVLLTAGHEDVKALTKYVVELPEFYDVTQLNASDILSAKEPLCIFIAAIGRRYENCDNYKQRCKIADTFNNYLKNFEKWIQCDETQQPKKADIMFRFYSFIAFVIYNTAPIVYIKSNINCFFHIAITRYILPPTVQMGKVPEPKFAQTVHKIWPVLIQGIGRLNFKTDPYISQTLNELLKKWTPYFKISSSTRLVARPFINCLQVENKDLSLYIFEKLATLFLSPQGRQSDPNACLIIAIYLEIVDVIVSSDNDNNRSEEQMEILLKSSGLVMLEHIIMVEDLVPSRSLMVDLFKNIITSLVFKTSSTLKNVFCEYLREITSRHLAFYTFFYFEMLFKIGQISYEPIEQILPYLMEEVRLVEQKRGVVGDDNRIRSYMQKLKLLASPTKNTLKHK